MLRLVEAKSEMGFYFSRARIWGRKRSIYTFREKKSGFGNKSSIRNIPVRLNSP